MSLDAGVQAVLDSPLYGITLTLGVFWLARRSWERSGRHALLNPVLAAIVFGAVVVWAFSGSSGVAAAYERYLVGGSMIAFLLGPATVALALPVYRHRETVRRAAPMIAVSLTAGSAAAIATGYGLTRALGGTEQIAASMAPKSATTPIAMALAEQFGGLPPLAAVFAIIAGVTGAVAGPALLNLARIRDPRARGLAMGTASHGIGTARMLRDDDTAGAFSGLAMGLNALASSLLIGGVLALLR